MYNTQFIVLLTFFSLLVIFAEMHVLFFATRSNYFVPLLNTTEPIFYKTMINDGDGFNNSASKYFTAPISDLCWFHVTIGVPSGSFVNVSLIGNRQSRYFLRTHSAFSSGAGATTQNCLLNLTAGNTLSLVSSYIRSMVTIPHTRHSEGFL